MKKIATRLWSMMLLGALLFSFMTPANAASKGYSFKYKGASISVGGSATKFLDKAGKPTKTSETKNCAGKPGKDVSYTYKYFKLTTYKYGSSETVQKITLTSKKVKTAEGIKVGSKERDVKKKYKGAKKNSWGDYEITKGTSKLSILMNDGKVESIEYTTK